MKPRHSFIAFIPTDGTTIGKDMSETVAPTITG